MNFNSKNELVSFLNKLPKLGNGSHGICYQKDNTVYKVFLDYLDDEEDEEMDIYTKEEIMRFNDVKNKTFIWPKDVITVDGLIVGYTTPLVNATDLYRINPLNINLDKLCSCIKESKKDIKIISQNGIVTYDLMYNIMYGNKFYILDHDEDTRSDIDPTIAEQKNNYNFDFELYYFLIDNYFNKIINSNKTLNKLYQDKDTNILIFIKELRKYLSELTGEKIQYLKQACKYVSPVNNPKYERELLKK